jgi:hypothetical protein
MPKIKKRARFPSIQGTSFPELNNLKPQSTNVIGASPPQRMAGKPATKNGGQALSRDGQKVVSIGLKPD